MKNKKSHLKNNKAISHLDWFYAAMIVTAVIFSWNSQASSNSGDYLVTKGTHSVRIRTSPNGRIIGSLNPNSKIVAVGQSQHHGWVKVKYQGRTAWIFKPLVTSASKRPIVQVPRQSPRIAALVELKTASAVDPIPPHRPRSIDIKVKPKAVVAPSSQAPVQPVQPQTDSNTTAGYCESCARAAQNPVAKVGEIASGIASAAGNVVTGAGEKIKSWFSNAWSSAVKPRQAAAFCGGGVRTGNNSKCMCAQAAKEALIKSGICNGPMPGNAIDLHRDGVILNQCPALKLSEITDPRLAPVPSLTIYSGYAGRRRHSYGHVEAKIMRDGKILYCSDFCRAQPTMSQHNAVAGIYIIK